MGGGLFLLAGCDENEVAIRGASEMPRATGRETTAMTAISGAISRDRCDATRIRDGSDRDRMDALRSRVLVITVRRYLPAS